MHRLVLASQSPRRRELLKRAGFSFTVTSPQISEIPDENLNLGDRIQRLALDKAFACLDSGKISESRDNLVLSADTVVVLDDQILGKPKDQEENRQFLLRLSSREHSVITAVCLVEGETRRCAVGHEVARVWFRALAAAEIDAYVVSGEGLDKAGGYGIQGDSGKFIARLEGAFDNVMGLPIALVERLLCENGWTVERWKG